MGNRITETNENFNYFGNTKLQTNDKPISLFDSSKLATNSEISNNKNKSFDIIDEQTQRQLSNESINNNNLNNSNNKNNTNSNQVPGISLNLNMNRSDSVDETSDKQHKSGVSKKIGSIRQIRMKSKKVKDIQSGSESPVHLNLIEKEILKKNSLLLPSMHTNKSGNQRRESFLYRGDIESFDSNQKVRKSSMASTDLGRIDG